MERPSFLNKIHEQFQINPVCALLGARQVGKTTLAHQYVVKYLLSEQAHFFDLENPLDLARLENPMITLSDLAEKFIVIDGIQRRPDLFSVLRVLVDKTQRKQKFLILGSASRDLIQQSSETLAGRISYIELPPFMLKEVADSKKLFLRGGFPLSYLAANEKISYEWRQDYISTFLERDIANLGFNVPPQQMRRFWLMLAHYHGQLFNASEIGRSLGISHHTVRKYLDILAGTFMVRVLPPWFENIKKRQVKSPKIYFRDSGILNALVGIADQDQLQTYPRLGSFWESFALEEVIISLSLPLHEYYFWATQAEAELDLLVVKGMQRFGFEFKYTDSPRTTKSMHSALADLHLNHLFVIYPGNQTFPLLEKITACGLENIASITLN